MFKFFHSPIRVFLFSLAVPLPALHNTCMSWITQTPRGIILSIHATPRASKAGIQGLHGDALKIRLRAPPVDGKANAALVEYLAELLKVPERSLSLLTGETGRQKRILVEGIDLATAASRLGIPAPTGD